MSANTHVLLSGALALGIPLVLAAGQMLVARRPRRGNGRPPPPPPPPPLPKPLPDCLIPRPMAPRTAAPRARPRVLEDA